MSKLFENTQDQASSQAQAPEVPTYGDTGLMDWTGGLGNQGMLEKLGITGTTGLDGPLPSVSRPDFLHFGVGPDASLERLEGHTQLILVLTELWRLPNPGDTVRMAMVPGSCEFAIELLWQDAWGPRPKRRDLYRYGPIEAKMALTFLQGLPAWGVLTDAERGDLEVLVGAEENRLSLSVRSELESMVRRGDFDDGDVISQVSQLRSLLVSVGARPLHSNEPGSLQDQVASTLEGPEHLDVFQFDGTEAEAMRWTLSLESGQSIEIIAPVTDDPAPTAVLNAVEAFTRMPDVNQGLVQRLIFNPILASPRSSESEALEAMNLTTFMRAGAAGDIYIYPMHRRAPPQETYGYMLIHETGHVWSMRRWGEDSTSEAWRPWRDAMTEDVVAVSGYAMNEVHDDFAETFDTYISTWGRPEHDEYRMIVPARFAILDQQLEPEMSDAR